MVSPTDYGVHGLSYRSPKWSKRTNLDLAMEDLAIAAVSFICCICEGSNRSWYVMRYHDISWQALVTYRSKPQAPFQWSHNIFGDTCMGGHLFGPPERSNLVTLGPTLVVVGTLYIYIHSTHQSLQICTYISYLYIYTYAYTYFLNLRIHLSICLSTHLPIHPTVL